jgi:hypothetical protein
MTDAAQTSSSTRLAFMARWDVVSLVCRAAFIGGSAKRSSRFHPSTHATEKAAPRDGPFWYRPGH